MNCADLGAPAARTTIGLQLEGSTWKALLIDTAKNGWHGYYNCSFFTSGDAALCKRFKWHSIKPQTQCCACRGGHTPSVAVHPPMLPPRGSRFTPTRTPALLSPPPPTHVAHALTPPSVPPPELPSSHTPRASQHAMLHRVAAKKTHERAAAREAILWPPLDEVTGAPRVHVANTRAASASSSALSSGPWMSLLGCFLLACLVHRRTNYEQRRLALVAFLHSCTALFALVRACIIQVPQQVAHLSALAEQLATHPPEVRPTSHVTSPFQAALRERIAAEPEEAALEAPETEALNPRRLHEALHDAPRAAATRSSQSLCSWAHGQDGHQ